MSKEDKVIELISELNNNQKKSFAIYCLERVINLYAKVDEKEDLSIVDATIKKGEAFQKLQLIFNKIKNSNQVDNIEELIAACDPLILDVEEVFDNTTENEVAVLVAQGVDYLLRYLQNEQNEYIEYCSSNNIEILNQLKSNQFYIQSNFKASDEEIMENVDTFLEQEYEIQIQMLELVLQEKDDEIEKLLADNIISWND